MKLAQLHRRIHRAESVLEGRQQQIVLQCQTVRQVWRAAWTPGRIVVAGLGIGFATGLSQPATALGGLAGKVGAVPKLLQMFSAISSLLSTTLAQSLSDAPAGDVNADEVEEVTAGTGRPAVNGRPAEPSAPSPAEAATDVSEY